MSDNKLNEIIETIKKKIDGRTFEGLPEKFAAEFQLKDSGVFYVEIKDGKINIEPYEYNDRDILVSASADTLKKILDNKLGIEKALITGKIKVSGNLQKAMFIKKIFK
ncbi:MAG: SCP2 sterol-binding domain-containing protein [Clostridium sp.]|nr:SCP2 sterol-binding domain-containing protein [Clostridium sp.]MCM1547312.1 SCP2 sterol-binding domain-containing protein [Ruminococcus sp.]